MLPPLRCLLLLLSSIIATDGVVVPVIRNPTGVNFTSKESDGGYYRSILIDSSSRNAYIGARNYVYKITLSDMQEVKNAPLQTDRERRPDFGSADTMVGIDYDTNSAVYKLINEDLKMQRPVQLMATEKLSEVYKLKNETFESQCRRQIRMLNLYYGDHLQLSLANPDVVCSRHSRGLAWLGTDQTKLFALKNGIFGTMPVAPTGVTDYEKGFQAWMAESSRISLDNPSQITKILGTRSPTQLQELFSKVAAVGRTCHSCNYSTSFENCAIKFGSFIDWCYREFAIPNFMATRYRCDFTPAPSRSVIDVQSMTHSREGPLPASSKESCSGGNLASTLLSGYHPDQVTKSLTSSAGNGVNGGAAIYVLAEIGQEKQLDVNHEAFMGFEEPMPLTSSATLALVRLMVKDGDVDHENIVASNPFKETWVTSPLTKFGRLVKTGNQATVPHRPRAVSLFEDEEYIYVLFREVEWESMLQPEYTVNRHHFLWKSYDRTISYPWEAARESPLIRQLERSDPAMYMMKTSYDSLRYNSPSFKKIINEHVYAPRLDAFKHTWDNSRVVSRVARVCKNDAGLPMGVQDASLFNLDNKMSLSAFQTFLKSKITCTVKVKAVPRSWRLRQDRFSFFYEKYWGFWKQGLNPCTENDGCMGGSCGADYINTTQTSANDRNEGVFCSRNKFGLDVSFRAFLDYTSRNLNYLNKKGQFQTTVNGWTQFHWAYMKDFATYTAVPYEYTELRDVYKLGDDMFGVFGSPQSESKRQGFAVPASTAVCRLTMAAVRQSFNGPFKKRVNNAWRPLSPDNSITPSPYSCQPDPVREEAITMKNMDIEFTDETLPLEDELKNFDMRGKSKRLNFFEKDVEGSRTMWNSVEAEPILTSDQSQYEKVVALQVNGVKVLFVTTTDGEIHKISAWKKSKNCWKPDVKRLEKWWQEETNLKNNSWGVNYFDLTQESQASGAEDRIFESEWDCTAANGHSVLSIIKPFKSATKIWDIKLSESQLIIGTDTEVMMLPVVQCDKYQHCGTCARDPHCGWDSRGRHCTTYKQGLLQSIRSPANCTACLRKQRVFDPGASMLLDTTLDLPHGADIDQFHWYHNGTKVKERYDRFVLTRNNSLLVMNARHEDSGVWELRDGDDNSCVVKYQAKLSECKTEECIYNKQYTDWCSEYDQWRDEMELWQFKMHESNCDSGAA